MVAQLGNTIITLDQRTARTIEVGDTLNVELTVRNVWPSKRILRSYRVMTVDRINELADCRLLRETEV